jgi:hypothetical protein
MFQLWKVVILYSEDYYRTHIWMKLQRLRLNCSLSTRTMQRHDYLRKCSDMKNNVEVVLGT